MPPKYKLIYFNVSGLGEVPRLIFSQAGVEFEDFRYPLPWVSDDWANAKKDTPFGKVPILEIDGQPIAQSQAIIQYLAREFGLEGKNNLEMAKVYEAYYMANDIMAADTKHRYEKDEKRKEQVKKDLIDGEYPRLLDALKTILGENDYLVGNTPTVADLVTYVAIERLQGLKWSDMDAMLEKTYDSVVKLKNRVAELPNIAAYLAKRPETLY